MEHQNRGSEVGSSLHLQNSLRTKAEEISAEEGISLNEFVNVTIAERLAHIEWVKRRKPITEERLASALAILNRAGSAPPEPGDELPEDYVRPADPA